MSKSRVQSNGRKTGRGTRKRVGKLARVQPEQSKPDSPCKRFVGISLSGGKADKASVAIVEFYPEHKKIFLSRLIDKIKAEELISADIKIHEMVQQYNDGIENICFDSPISLPKCLQCKLKCPGYESCQEPEIKFIRNIYLEEDEKKKPKKMFTPYTQRATDAWLAHISEGEFEVQHALGANSAPLTARALFISRRFSSSDCFEVSTRMSVWRLGLQLKINKSQLRSYRNSVGGSDARKLFLASLVEKTNVFIYQQDMKSMIDDIHAFESFICAYMGYLKLLNLVEGRIEGFPRSEVWPVFPKSN